MDTSLHANALAVSLVRPLKPRIQGPRPIGHSKVPTLTQVRPYPLVAAMFQGYVAPLPLVPYFLRAEGLQGA